MITMKLVNSNFLTRWPCDVCGGCTEKVPILCEGVTEDHETIRVCERCLEEGQDQIDNFLRSHICKIQAHAQFLRGLIGQLKVPSFEEYKAAEKAVHEEYDRQWKADDPEGYAAEHDAVIVDDSPW
jgi:hypothetical protein